MKSMLTIAILLPLCTLLIVNGCAQHHPPADPAYLAEIESWHSERLARLEAEDGWLSLAGLFWLETGENHLGAAVENAIAA